MSLFGIVLVLVLGPICWFGAMWLMRVLALLVMVQVVKRTADEWKDAKR